MPIYVGVLRGRFRVELVRVVDAGKQFFAQIMLYSKITLFTLWFVQHAESGPCFQNNAINGLVICILLRFGTLTPLNKSKAM